MKQLHLLQIISLFVWTEFTHAQEWRLYTASDAVTNFARYHDDIWTISGSGLSKVNMLTGEFTTWNTVNSNLSDYYCKVMSIDSSGNIWLGVENDLSNVNPSKMIRFNGIDFEIITEINGERIYNISAIETTPDGKTWILAHTDERRLFLFDQNQFFPISPPSNDFRYGGFYSNLGVGDNSHIWAVLSDTASNQEIIGEYDGTQWVLHDVSNYGEPSSGDPWAFDHLGNVFILMSGHVSPIIFLEFNGQQWAEIPLPPSAIESRFIENPLHIDNKNQIWLSLANNKLLHNNGNSWTDVNLGDFGFINGQPDKFLVQDSVHWWMMYEQKDEWPITKSLYRYDGTGFHSVILGNSNIPSNSLSNIIVDELNNKWLSSKRDLLKFDGNNWTSIHTPDEIFYPFPVGSNKNGGVWLYPYEPYIPQFDGVTFSNTVLTDTSGIPLDYFTGYKVDHLGRLVLAISEPNILVYDHGHIVYLDSTFYETYPDEFYPDNVYDVAVHSSGRIYAIGSYLHRMEQDSTWTNIPLWNSWDAFGYKIFIAPDEKIWALDPYSLPFENKYWIYDGVQWHEVESAHQFGWKPQWDLNGKPWFLSYSGLCKYENETWFCYDRTNSPIIPERISSFHIDPYNNFWVTVENGGLLVFNEDHIQNINGQETPLLSGHIYRDINQNGIKDISDTPLGSHRALLLPEKTIAFSNSSGTYRLSASSGDHEIKYIPRPNWHIDNSPSTYTVNVSLDSISGLDFNLAPDQEIRDLQLYFTEGFPRCGHWSTYWLNFINRGTMTASGEITFIKDPNAELGAIYPLPYWTSGDTIKWLFSDIHPFGSGQIRMEVLIPNLPGTFLAWKGYLDVIANHDLIRADSFSISQEIRCSFDPNDKIGRSVRSDSEGQSYLGDPLLYTIRFQNTGNDTAFNIIIRDTLDADLDLNSLEIISASHPYEAFLKQDRTLEFRFMNILLPDSTINEIASHGFVTYTIKAKPGLTSPTNIENTAHIYFDFNTVEITNTVVNELVEFGTGLYHEPKLVSLLSAHPNPTSDIILIQAMISNPGTINFTLITSQGQTLQSGLLYPGETTQLSLVKYPSGLYILRAENSNGFQSITLVKGK